VGNPTADEVRQFVAENPVSKQQTDATGLPPRGEGKPIIALLAGSRRQEIKDNLPAMIEATRDLVGRYSLVLAGAPSIEEEYYRQFLQGTDVQLIENQTYPLLARAHAALVTSGTATLETALFGVPQVVCYRTVLPRFIGYMRKKILKVPFVSLVNLIAGREVVRELVADSFTLDNIRAELHRILDGDGRRRMLEGYEDVRRRLGNEDTSLNAARLMYQLLTQS
jgi:lipid-A-disaccharide synthase